MACAQTGSGKTGGFLFPVIAQMLRKGPKTPSGALPLHLVYPSAVILAPTRELAVQIYDEARKVSPEPVFLLALLQLRSTCYAASGLSSATARVSRRSSCMAVRTLDVRSRTSSGVVTFWWRRRAV